MANSKRKCCGCKEYHPVETMIKLPVGWFCRLQCSINYATKRSQKAQERQKKQSDTKARVIHKRRVKALKTKSQWIKEAQSAVNKYIRIRDTGLGCISCGSLPDNKRGGTMDAGHYRSRGAAPHLRFNTWNISAQCVKCNRFNSGSAVDYRLGLIERIGIERVEQLEQNNTSNRFTVEYLERIKKIFNKRARHLARLRGYDI